MDDPAPVGRQHRLRQHGQERGSLFGHQESARESLGEAPTLKELHGEVRPAVEVADVVDLHDVDVPKASLGFGLEQEAPRSSGRT